ncbi:MAG: sodium/proton-translocating pyrophosphatase, partial [Actinomycetota bacterium]
MHGILAQEGGPIEVVFTKTETNYLWLIFGISLVALVFAYYLVREVLAAPEGTEKMKEIARAIQEGAKAYLSRQFRTLGIFLALLTVVLFFILPAPENAEHSEFSIKFGRSLAFILGAGFSAITGYAGMWLAVRANVRTANA